MALRPLRNAMISFGLVSIPVRFYTASKSEDIHFNLLHASCGTRVNRKWWCPHHEKIVDSDELIRGYAISKSKYVTFADEEIEALETDSNRALDITEFVDLAEIDPIFFEKAYFLGPAPGGGKTYKDRKSTRLNSSHTVISYAVFCLKKKIKKDNITAKCKE